jgi:hypothetical protein
MRFVNASVPPHFYGWAVYSEPEGRPLITAFKGPKQFSVTFFGWSKVWKWK